MQLDYYPKPFSPTVQHLVNDVFIQIHEDFKIFFTIIKKGFNFINNKIRFQGSIFLSMILILCQRPSDLAPC